MPKLITDEKLIDNLLSRGVENIYPNKEALKKLLMSGKKIKLYCGFDPTSPTLHIGNGIQIRKLAKFQELGHDVIFLYGDFTAMIGDPTDKTSARQPLTTEQIKKNLKGWKDQIKMIIDLNKVDFRFNSKWLGKMSFADLLKVSSDFTVQQMMERDMFQERIKKEKPIFIHEFMYPLMQAYDSVVMDVDLEIGGNDQTFNMLAGRTLMRKTKNKEKMVLTTKLLEDPTGKKMGKSEGNMITLVDSPEDLYGKVMSWPDTLMIVAFEILTDVDYKQKEKELASGKNPRDLKMELAYEVVKVYQGDTAAKKAQDNFRRVFQEKEKPLEIPEIKLSESKMGVLDLFVKAGLASSNGEVRRLIREGAILIDDQKVVDEKLVVSIPLGGLLLQRGKKMFVRVKC